MPPARPWRQGRAGGAPNRRCCSRITLSRPVSELWAMQNGYALCLESGLRAISGWMAKAAPDKIDELRGQLAIGLHQYIEVTEAGAPVGHLVSQAFCSALPVAYTLLPSTIWEPFAALILEAAYEATLLAGAVQAANGGSNIVLLTLLGGGAFGNSQTWIFAAIRRALGTVIGLGLDVRIVSYGEPITI